MQGHRSTPRALAATFAAVVGLCAVPALASAPQPSPAAAKAEQKKQVAGVEVEIRQESGEVVKGDTQLDWNQDGSLSIEKDGTKHKLALRVDRDGNSNKLSVTLAYARGGKDIVAPYTFDAKVKKREVLRIEGNLAIAVTITPKQAAKVEAPKTEEEPGKNKPKLDVSGNSEDPLAGLD